MFHLEAPDNTRGRSFAVNGRTSVHFTSLISLFQSSVRGFGSPKVCSVNSMRPLDLVLSHSLSVIVLVVLK